MADDARQMATAKGAAESPFLTNCWYVAAWDHEVGPDKPLARRILGEDVVLYRRKDGQAVAMVDRCCHRLAPLSLGRIEGDCLRCMYHGLLFDPDGRCVDVPRQEIIGPNLKVRVFPTAERYKYVWIWMGDPARADPASIPDCHWQDDPAWRSIPGYVHYPQASYMLIVDNLLEFSHLAFVHENTLGGGRSSAEVEPVIERFDWGVRTTRWYHNDPLPPYLKHVAHFDGLVDRWQVIEWRIESNMLSMNSGSAPAGTGAPEGKLSPLACVFHSCQLVTPETATSAHYFWTYAHNFDLDNPKVTRELYDQVALGFEEDKAIIQAQQKVVSEHPDERMIAIGADAALQYVRSLLKRKLAAESSGDTIHN
jgi:phenylpropionate dioxygenase-like ring-hydroxylating dioxygenase large terminal subunit